MDPIGQPVHAEKVLIKSLSELITTVNDAFDGQSKLGFFILLFSSIDVFASLQRPKIQPTTSGEWFKEWVNSYLLPGSGLNCTAEELWGARCGMLHTLTAGSNLSRQGKARQIHYVSAGNSGVLPYLQAEFDKAGKSVVLVDHHVLLLAHIKAVQRFIKAIQTDSDLKDRALFHAETLLSFESLPHTNLSPS